MRQPQNDEEFVVTTQPQSVHVNAEAVVARRTSAEVLFEIETVKCEIAGNDFSAAPRLPGLQQELESAKRAEAAKLLQGTRQTTTEATYVKRPNTPRRGSYAGQSNASDQHHGEGVFHYENGDVFRGQWLDGNRQGHGLYKYHTGDTYEGHW